MCLWTVLVFTGRVFICMCEWVSNALPLCSWKPLSVCAGPQCRAGNPPFSVCTSQTLLKPDGDKKAQPHCITPFYNDRIRATLSTHWAKHKQTEWRPAAVSDLSLHVLVEFHRFFQTGQPPPQVCLVRHLTLVLHDLVSGLCHNVLDLSGRNTTSCRN